MSKRKRSHDGFIYFVKAKRSGLIKIGFACDVADRVKTLQTGCPFELELIGSARGTRQTEGWLHRHFEEDRVRGEWFKGDGEVKELAGVVREFGENIRLASSSDSLFEIFFSPTPL